MDVNDSSSGKYSANKNIRFKTSMLTSDLCGFRDDFTVVKGQITIEEDNNGKTRNEKLLFKSNAPLWSWILKISNTFIDNPEDCEIVIPTYNLLEYSENCSVIITEMQ